MKIVIAETAIPTRLDKYLKKIYPLLSQGIIEKALRIKQIEVNDEKAAASLRVKTGDQITFSPYFIMYDEITNVEQGTGTEKISGQKYAKNIVILAEKILTEYLIYQDENILVINKPNNLSSQGGSKIKLSINDALNYLNNQQGKNLRLVHRLDKRTSGCFIIAKNHLASVRLGEAFKDKIISKTYHAVTIGTLKQEEGQISNLIAKNREGGFESVKEDKKNGKLAITQYKLLKKCGDLSYIEFKPLTGRMHQLRFHAQILGTPILGDDKYGLNGPGQAALMSENMLLHAIRINIPKSVFDKEIMVKADLPNYFNKFIKS